QYCGHPFLATGIYGALYPLNALYLVMPPTWALEAIAQVHVVIAGVGTYAFTRNLGLSRLAAALAAIGYMLSGFLVSEALTFPPAVAASSWLPFALLAIDRLVEAPTTGWVCVLAVANALAFLTGWPQT